MTQSNNSEIIGIIAIVLGGLLVLGGLMFLLVIITNSAFPRVFLVPPLVQIALGLLASAAGYFVRQGHAVAKFVLAFVAIDVVVNVVFLILLAVLTMG